MAMNLICTFDLRGCDLADGLYRTNLKPFEPPIPAPGC